MYVYKQCMERLLDQMLEELRIITCHPRMSVYRSPDPRVVLRPDVIASAQWQWVREKGKRTIEDQKKTYQTWVKLNNVLVRITFQPAGEDSHSITVEHADAVGVPLGRMRKVFKEQKSPISEGTFNFTNIARHVCKILDQPREELGLLPVTRAIRFHDDEAIRLTKQNPHDRIRMKATLSGINVTLDNLSPEEAEMAVSALLQAGVFDPKKPLKERLSVWERLRG